MDVIGDDRPVAFTWLQTRNNTNTIRRHGGNLVGLALNQTNIEQLDSTIKPPDS
jgi:hypothetical protein